MCWRLEVAEEPGTDEQTDAQTAVVLVVVEHVLAITVIEMQHQELVVLLADAETDVNNGVATEVPTLTLDTGHIGHPTLVGGEELRTRLENTAVLEDVLVLLAVDNGNPCLGMHHQTRVNKYRAGKRDFVPAARCLTVSAI